MNIGGFFKMMDISASALQAERTRMNVVANNLANAYTTHDTEGNPSPFRRKMVQFKPGSPEITGSETLGVQVSEITPDEAAFRRVHQPTHPDADAEGFVSMPNVDVPTEMMDMMVASRAYEANITAMESAKQIIRSALQIIA